MDKSDFPNIKKFCPVRDTVRMMKTQAEYWEKTFANEISDDGLIHY